MMSGSRQGESVMANMFNMMKQAASMKKQMKQMQKELARKMVDGTDGGVTVSVRGDMSVASIKIDPEKAPTADLAKLESAITRAANKALELAKKEAGAEMSRMAGGLGGLTDMLGLG